MKTPIFSNKLARSTGAGLGSGLAPEMYLLMGPGGGVGDGGGGWAGWWAGAGREGQRRQPWRTKPHGLWESEHYLSVERKPSSTWLTETGD